MSNFQNIPIAQISESPTNPRRRFNEQKMLDLIQSVQANGILNPILVRPIDTRNEAEKDLEALHLLSKKPDSSQCYEILAGARRYRAARAVDLAEIPAIVREVDDDMALEIQVFENEQREDVHQLEQATGYKRLLDRNHTVPEIAAKLGCSESHVYKRLKLLDLIETIQDAFLQDRITAEHALLIARLQPKDQEKAFAECFEKYNDNRLISAARLADWIESQIHLDLASAPFSLTDEDLVPAACSCMQCPKRTGFNQQLFPDIQKEDTCTDGACFKKKVQAHINQTIARHEEKGKELLKVTLDYSAKEGGPLPQSKFTQIRTKEGSCENVKNALIVSGREGKGKVIKVCADPNCKVHKRQSAGGQNHSNAQDYEKQQKLREEKAKKEQGIREGVLIAIVEKAKDSDWIRDDWNMVALQLLDKISHQSTLIILKNHGIEVKVGQTGERIEKMIHSLPIEELVPLIVEIVISDSVPVSPWDDRQRPKILLAAAKRYKVDIAAIEKKLEVEARAGEQTEKAAEKTERAKPDKKKKAPRKPAKQKSKAKK